MGERGDVMELDTSFHEDESQIYEGYSQENLSVIYFHEFPEGLLG